MVRALASLILPMSPGSFPELDAKLWVEFIARSRPCSERFKYEHFQIEVSSGIQGPQDFSREAIKCHPCQRKSIHFSSLAKLT